MITQKHIVWMTIIVLTLSAQWSFAQETKRQEFTIRQAPFGLYIDIGQVPASGIRYQIFRKTAEQSDFEQIGMFSPAEHEADFAMRIADNMHLLQQYSILKPELVSALWEGYRGAERDNLRQHGELPFLDLATGITFADTTAVAGMDYRYQLRFSDGRELNGDTKSNMQKMPRFAPVELYDTDAGYSKVTLQWKSPRAGAAPDWTVWRKQVGSNIFRQIEAERGVRTPEGTDSLLYIVIDSLIYSGVSYDYYLQLHDVLGNEANQSDTLRIEVGGRKNVPIVSDFDTESDSSGIRLVWKLPAATASLRSLLVLRSDNYDNGYQLIASVPATDTCFIDQGVTGGVNYFYQLIAEGDVNFSQPTARVSGMFYPVYATTLNPVYEVEIKTQDSSIMLNWQYNDTDIAGFRVFRALAMDGDYAQIGDLIPTHAIADTNSYVYVDSAGLLASTMYYYKVAPVSHTYANGFFSNPVGAVAKGISKIATPQGMRGILLSDTTVHFAWGDLQRSTPGIGGYAVYRKTDVDSAFTEEHRVGFAHSNEFVDTLRWGEAAWYALRARSVSGELSDFSVPVMATTKQIRPHPPGSFRGYTQEMSILLTWDGQSNGTITRYHIYRATNNEALELLTQVTADSVEQAYIDSTVKPGNRYYYYIVAEHVSGTLSDRTNEIILEIE